MRLTMRVGMKLTMRAMIVTAPGTVEDVELSDDDSGTPDKMELSDLTDHEDEPTINNSCANGFVKNTSLYT